MRFVLFIQNLLIFLPVGLFSQELPQVNQNTGIISIHIVSEEGSLITQETHVALLKVSATEVPFDTIASKLTSTGAIDFEGIENGAYLVGVEVLETNRNFTPRYFGNSHTWLEADTLITCSDTTVSIEMIDYPEIDFFGDYKVDILVEEDLQYPNGRETARRRAMGKNVWLTRKAQDSDAEFELIGQGKTNENGEMQWGFLAEGIYGFFVEYPGLHTADSSFLQFHLESTSQACQQAASIEAFVTKLGIEMDFPRYLKICTGVKESIEDFQVYPNPALSVLYLNLNKSSNDLVKVSLTDLLGRIFWQVNITDLENRIRINTAALNAGIYLIQIHDQEGSPIGSRRIVLN